MKKNSSADKRNIGLIGIGFLPGFLLPLGISVEEVILFPFFGGLVGFDLLVVVFTIVVLVSGILALIKRLQLASGLGSFAFSFAGGYLMATSIDKGMNVCLILIGLIALLISFGLTMPAFES